MFRSRLIAGILCLLGFQLTLLAQPPIRVVAGIAPYAWLAEQIGGEHVSVEVLVPSGSDPHTYQPLPRQLVSLSQSEFFLASAMPFERGMRNKLKTSFSGIWVDLSDGFAHRTMFHDCSGHGHDDHAHHHEITDPHVWLSLKAMAGMAKVLQERLSTLRPDLRDYFEQRVAALVQHLQATDATLETRLLPLKGRSLLVYHPAWGYFTDQHGIELIAVERDGKAPTARQLAELLRAHQEKPLIGLMLTQPQSNRRGSEMVAKQLHLQLEVADPLAGDVPSELLRLTDLLLAAERDSRREPGDDGVPSSK